MNKPIFVILPNANNAVVNLSLTKSIKKEESHMCDEFSISFDNKFERLINELHQMIDWDKLKIAEEKAFWELKRFYPEFISTCNLLEKND